MPRAWALAPLEVIVADGGSQDRSAAVAQAFACTWLSTAAGRGNQLRAGAAVAKGDVLLFLHADCWLAAEAAEQIQSALQNPRVKGGAFHQSAAGTSWAVRTVLWGNSLRVRWQGLAYGDQAIFIRRAFYQELGGFPAWPLMEDVALMQAFCRKSWPVLLKGPVEISPRRWQKYGLLQQTLRNWGLMLAYRWGVAPERLARWYRRQDQ